MKVSMERNEIVIKGAIEPKLSKSGKSMVLSTSGGNQETELEFEGKTIIVGYFAYIKR